MNIQEIIKLKKVYVTAIIGVSIVGLWSYNSYRRAHQPPNYETITVEQGNLVQTVQATGKVESTDDVALRFEIPGILQTITVREGQTIKAGALLASLRLGELNASVAQASANLQQKIAGATNQDRDYYKAALDAAEVGWKQAQTDAATQEAIAETAVKTALNNLKLVEGGDNSLIVTAAYETGVTTLHVAIAKLDDALTQGKKALDYLSVVQTDDQIKRAQAQAMYTVAFDETLVARSFTSNLTTKSQHSLIDQAFVSTEKALATTIQMLSKINDALSVIPPATNVTTQTSIDAQKTAITTIRTTLTAQYSTTVGERQDISDAKNSYTTYSIAYTKAKRDLEQVQSNGASTSKIKEAQYLQAKANYEAKIVPTRPVDLAPYQAALAQAVASRNKAILRAPMNGIVAKINKKRGELVTSADSVVQMTSPHYEINVDIPETDIAKIVDSPERNAVFTLDAFGSDKKFPGVITSIDKKSTEIQDVVYYQVTVALTTSTPSLAIQSGMTANVTITTNRRENVLFVPQRVIRTRDNSEKFVRVLNNNQEQEITVKLGLRGDNGKVEILDGLSLNQTVIVSIKET